MSVKTWYFVRHILANISGLHVDFNVNPPKAPPDINSFLFLSDVCRTKSFELNPICHFVWQKDSLKFSQYTLNHDLLFINKDVVLDELLSSKVIEFFLAWLSKAQFFSGSNINLWETDPCLVFDWGNTSYFWYTGLLSTQKGVVRFSGFT